MNNIKNVIKDKGFRMEFVAEQINAHPSHLSMWISEDRFPSQERLQKLTKLLKVKVSDLYPDSYKKMVYVLKEDKPIIL
jgi:transcriptional regulator with XRE-family HTH domain